MADPNDSTSGIRKYLGISPRTILLLIILAAVALRVWGLDFGLPQVFHPDEPVLVTNAVYSVATNDYNPRAFHWPSLQMYILCVEYGLWFQAGKLSGAWIPDDAEWSQSDGFLAYSMRAPAGFYYLGRLTTVLFSAGLIWIGFILARRFMGIKASLVVAALIAFHPIITRHSRLVTPDIPTEFFFLAALYFLDRLYMALLNHSKESNRDAANKTDDPVRMCIFSAMMVGLATGTKYPAAVLIVPVIAVVLFSPSGYRITTRILLALRATLVTAVTFFLTTPFALLDWRQFVTDIQAISLHVRTGHIGMEATGGIWLASLNQLVKDSDWGWTVVGVIGLIVFLYNFRRTWPMALALLFVLIGLAPLDVFSDRYLVPLIPFMAFGIGWLIACLQPDKRTGAIYIPILLILLVTAGHGLVVLCRDAHYLTLPDTREYALEWVHENIPAQSYIVKEQGGPDLFLVNPLDPDPESHARLLPDPWYYGRELTPVFARTMINLDPLDTLLITLPDYVITSSQVRNRYMREGAEEEFPDLVAIFREYYRLIDNYLIEEARFTPGDGIVGAEVVIYRVPEGFWESVVIEDATVPDVLGRESE